MLRCALRVARQNLQSFTRGGTDHFSIYLLFPIQVCFSADNAFVAPHNVDA